MTRRCRALRSVFNEKLNGCTALGGLSIDVFKYGDYEREAPVGAGYGVDWGFEEPKSTPLAGAIRAGL